MCIGQSRLLAAAASIVIVACLKVTFFLVARLLDQRINWRFNRRKNNFVFLRQPFRRIRRCVFRDSLLLLMCTVWGWLARGLLVSHVEPSVLVVEIVAVRWFSKPSDRRCRRLVLNIPCAYLRINLRILHHGRATFRRNLWLRWWQFLVQHFQIWVVDKEVIALLVNLGLGYKAVHSLRSFWFPLSGLLSLSTQLNFGWVLLRLSLVGTHHLTACY